MAFSQEFETKCSSIGHAGSFVFPEWSSVPPAAAQRIETVVAENFGVTTHAVLTDLESLAISRDVAYHVFPDLLEATCLVFVIAAPVSAETIDTLTQRGALVARAGVHVVQWCPGGVSTALAIGPLLERAGADIATARNLATVEKVLRAAQ